MSKVLYSGELNSSYWRYPSLEMETCLKKIIKKKSIKKNDIPEGIYKDLSGFFRITLGAIKKTNKENSLAQIANYRIAANAIRKSAHSPIKERSDIERNIQEYANEFKMLSQTKRLKKDEIQKIEKLTEFFHQIFLDSDSEIYNKTVSSSFVD